ncbi:MAG: ATPase, T2SS/T4P/T4SS family, partial [Actinomycetes bacterium]
HINNTREAHIVTIEDPIEVMHEDKRCIISQREIGIDTDSYEDALRHVVRQDPDVILIGEMRDYETVSASLTAAEIGIQIHPESWIYCSPCVGSYVGGDITAGLLCTDLVTETEEINLFIDIGTNGELVLGNRDFLMTCACSAGPAFEGGGIECGMRAASGANCTSQTSKVVSKDSRELCCFIADGADFSNDARCLSARLKSAITDANRG